MKKKKLLRLSSLLLMMLSGVVFANQSGQSDWFQRTNWSAFVSQTAIYSSDYNFLSQSDDSLSFDMWEAGFLASTVVKEKLTFSAQLLGRKVSEASGDDLRVDYAFFSYPFYQTMTDTIGVRLGRIRSSYGLYNETRDMPHTRTGIVMPQSIYFDKTRNSFYSADGIELFGYRDIGDQRLSAQVFFSKPVADEDETGEVAPLNPTSLEGDRSILAKVSYGSEYDGFRTSFTYYRPEYKVDVTLTIGPNTLEDNDASFYSESMITSLEYNQFDWSLTAEYLRHKFQSTFPRLSSIPGQQTKKSGYEEAFYIQGLYRLSERWETYMRYDSSEWHVNRTLADHEKWHDINIGGSFRPNENWLLRAEVHYIEGLSRLLSRDNKPSQAQDPYWTAAMFQVAYKW
jgi:hypothetical protein